MGNSHGIPDTSKLSQSDELAALLENCGITALDQAGVAAAAGENGFRGALNISHDGSMVLLYMGMGQYL